MLIDELFVTWWENNPDYNNADKQNADLRLLQRNSAIHDHLYNGIELDYVFDVFREQGLDPEEYLLYVERKIEIVIANEIPLEDIEFWNFRHK